MASHRWSIATNPLIRTITEMLRFKQLRSRPRPFGDTWRHWSRYRWTHNMWIPIGGLL